MVAIFADHPLSDHPDVDVRLQEAGEEEDQEAERRVHGHDGEVDPAASDITIRGLTGLRLRNKGRPLPRPDPPERR